MTTNQPYAATLLADCSAGVQRDIYRFKVRPAKFGCPSLTHRAP
ncbi:hypothetical protein [Pseudomonas grimontii]|jgi:hypothetical protein